MRKLVCAIILVVMVMVMFGCAGQGNLVKHQLDVNVKSATDSMVSVDSTEQKYERAPNPELKISMFSSICTKHNIAFMKIFSGISISDVTSIFNDIQYLYYMTDIRKVKLFINSPGGDAFSGLALADSILNAQKDYGIEFEAHANGIIASAAVPVLAVCNKRLASKGTIFMVHEAALWKWPGRETASDIRSQNELMIMLQDRYLSYLVDHSKLDLAKWQAMEQATTWFSATKALEIGLIDAIK